MNAAKSLYVLVLLVLSLVVFIYGSYVGLFKKEWAEGTFFLVLAFLTERSADAVLKGLKKTE